MPLVYLGAYFGFHKPPLEFPNATSTIPKPIPFDATPWYLPRGGAHGSSFDRSYTSSL